MACMIEHMQASILTLFIAYQWFAKEWSKKNAHWLRNGFLSYTKWPKKKCSIWQSNLPLNLKKVWKLQKNQPKNVALYEIRTRWERKKAENNSNVASSDGMYSPVPIIVTFLPVTCTAAADCVLHCRGVVFVVLGALGPTCIGPTSTWYSGVYHLFMVQLCHARFLDLLLTVPDT